MTGKMCEEKKKQEGEVIQKVAGSVKMCGSGMDGGEGALMTHPSSYFT